VPPPDRAPSHVVKLWGIISAPLQMPYQTIQTEYLVDRTFPLVCCGRISPTHITTAFAHAMQHTRSIFSLAMCAVHGYVTIEVKQRHGCWSQTERCVVMNPATTFFCITFTLTRRACSPTLSHTAQKAAVASVAAGLGRLTDGEEKK
jgi:hypothetical protein